MRYQPTLPPSRRRGQPAACPRLSRLW